MLEELLCSKLANIALCDNSFSFSDGSLSDSELDNAVGGDGEGWLLSARGSGQRN